MLLCHNFREPARPAFGAWAVVEVFRRRLAADNRSALAASQLALRATRHIDLLDTSGGARRTVSLGTCWHTSAVFLSERSLIISLVESASLTTQVSFRVNLADVLALPAD